MKSELFVLELLSSLSQKENFRLHPVVIFESDFIAVGDDIEKKKQTAKFTKRLRVMNDAMNTLHELRSNIMNCLRDFAVYYKMVGTNFGYAILAKQYGALEKVLKAYNKFLNSQANNPEIVELCEQFPELNDLNVFDLMLSDLEKFKPEVEDRIAESKKRYPDFVPNSEVSAEINFDVLKKSFKNK